MSLSSLQRRLLLSLLLSCLVVVFFFSIRWSCCILQMMGKRAGYRWKRTMTRQQQRSKGGKEREGTNQEKVEKEGGRKCSHPQKTEYLEKLHTPPKREGGRFN